MNRTSCGFQPQNGSDAVRLIPYRDIAARSDMNSSTAIAYGHTEHNVTKYFGCG